MDANICLGCAVKHRCMGWLNDDETIILSCLTQSISEHDLEFFEDDPTTRELTSPSRFGSE